MQIRLEPGWLERLEQTIQSEWMQQLRRFLRERHALGKAIYPHPRLWFNALNLTPFDAVRVVVIGQDPYHRAGQAHGLCFSVPQGVAAPPSLQNIFQEVRDDVGIDNWRTDLDPWARQGVLLLNAVLTVEGGKPGSHAGQGWERFTDVIIDELNRSRDHLVFILWGNYAQKKCAVIDERRHLVLRSSHPSPFSANSGFFGSRPFSATNRWLAEKGLQPIDWQS